MKTINRTIPSLALLALAVLQSPAQPTYEPYTFTTLAGGGGYSTNQAGSAARFWNPIAVAVDSAGNVYVADQGNNSISKVTPAGAVTTLAGRPGSFGSANGTGSAARFYEPSGVALDSAGNVYVADTLNHTIRKVTPAGVVTTLAGQVRSPGSANGALWTGIRRLRGIQLEWMARPHGAAPTSGSSIRAALSGGAWGHSTGWTCREALTVMPFRNSVLDCPEGTRRQ